MKQDTRAEALFDAFGGVRPDLIEGAAPPVTGTRRRRPARRTLLTAALCAACVLLLTVTVVAVLPVLHVNLPFVGRDLRQDTVPDGWTGVYTLADLDAIRARPDGFYILMNDIDVPADAPALSPIGTREAPFIGQLDGNGHTIRGLRVEAEITEDGSAGLFGVCAGRPAPEGAEGYAALQYHGLFSYDDPDVYAGLIKNLRVEDAEIRAAVTQPLPSDSTRDPSVGVIAGSATYLAGCSVRGCTVILTAGPFDTAWSDRRTHVAAGGLCGVCTLIDSCSVEGLTVTASGLAPAGWDGASVAALPAGVLPLHAGALCGCAYTAETSFSRGCVLSVEGDETALPPAAYVCGIPAVIAEHDWTALADAFAQGVAGRTGQVDPQESFYYKKLCSCYFRFDPADPGDVGTDHWVPAYLWNQVYFTKVFPRDSVMRILDPCSSVQEKQEIEEMMRTYVSDEMFAALFTREAGYKYGKIGVYDLSPDVRYGKRDFPEFDFASVWRMEDGRPTLRMFG